MIDIARGVPCARAPEVAKRRQLQLGIASALAAGMLAGVSPADARITQIQILSRVTAFGGYSFPGVGQYEAITGICHRGGQSDRPEERGDHRHRARAEEHERQCRLSA